MSIRELTLYQALLLAFTLFYIPAQAAQTTPVREGYYALVIGNGAYRGRAGLPNAVNDASAIRDTLQELGYTVIYGKNLDWAQTHRKINRFIQSAPHMKAAAFFYSGHAVQIQGSNYMVTVDAKFDSEKNMVRSLWSMQPLFEDIANRSDTGLLILDSCRNNPFGKQINASASQNSYNITRSISVINEQSSMIGREYSRSRAIGRAPEPVTAGGTETAQEPRRLTARELKIGKGLAKTSVDGNMFIAYATSPGKVAADGRGKHSPFTTALLKYMKEPDLEIQPMFTRVRGHVYKATYDRATGKAQRPWNTSGLLDPFYMNRRTLPENRRVATFYRPEPEVKREKIFTAPVLQPLETGQTPDVGTGVKNRDKATGKAQDRTRQKVRKKARRKNRAKGRARKNRARKARPKARAKKKITKKARPRVRAKKKTAKKVRPKARTKRKTVRKARPKARVKKKIVKKARVKKKVARKTRKKVRAKPRKRVARKKTVRKTRTAARRAPARRNTGGSPTSSGFVGF